MLTWSKGNLLLAIILLNTLSVLLLLTLDYNVGWNWVDYSYNDFWTVDGFVRNLFFNGWHPIIPWLSFLLFGMLLSKCALEKRKTQFLMLGGGVIAVVIAESMSSFLAPVLATLDPELVDLVSTAAVPPTPLYSLAASGAASVVIALCLLLRNGLAKSGLLAIVTPAGRQSLTLYIAHIVIGMGALEVLGILGNQSVTFSLIASVVFCLLSVLYAFWWSRYFKRGPIEMLMRKLAG